MKKNLNFWKSLTSGSVNRQIFGAAIIVAIGTAFVKVLTVGKELVVAWKFGTGDAIDAFLIALIVPSFIINVVAGSFNAALIPTYIKVRDHEGREASQRLFSTVMVWSLGLLVITTVLMLLSAPLYLPQIASGFSPEKLDLTFQLFFMMSPVVLVNGIQVIWGAVLNAGERFALVALVPTITPTITVLFLLLGQSWGSFALAAGIVCGSMMELVILGVVLKRQGISLLPRWYGLDANVRQVAGQYAPMIAGALLMSSTNIVDQAMAAMLLPGSVAALNYGNRVIAFPMALISTGLSTAIIPYYSKMIATENWTGVRDTLKHYLLSIFKITVPLTCFFFFFSNQIISILFKRGSFSVEDVHVVTQVQAFFCLQMPFYVGGILLVRLISAIRYNHILMWAAVVNLISNVSLNYLFVKYWGVAGIALSTSCVYLISFMFLFGFWLRFSRKNQ
ncbi:virulence factor MVIN family protein [Crinalium epipsammum PCC 9333]|uniref:Virulence factor MVIN family protein n=1 Tax=Crinalium epipsammum PCC 9333 TaxID=1173022 RepID=K9W1R7_9CYAN|nr:lipid II flippase MurJ [Crinalium epipsammum]AFZ14313.1 virulence factor MVIN family protein [Crinalium epipsammum PCC 9333]